MKLYFGFYLIFSALINLTFVQSSSACPLIDGLVDYNCDGFHKVVVVGDSIVKGIGDLKFKNNGGYVRRLQRFLPKSTIVNMGKPGFSTDRLLTFYKSSLSKKGSEKIKAQFSNADILIIDAGRNDFFTDGSPEVTITYLKRIVTYLTRQLSKDNKSSGPLITIATLLPTTRGFQRSFIDNVNLLLVEMFSETFLPTGIFFNTLSEDIISVDGIHPDSDGYKVIAEYAALSIATDIQDRSRAARPDSDNDGIYDRFEKPKFKTNPNEADTDKDGLLDGEEVFTYFTNPLVADTDQDGIGDGLEVEAGTNPLE